MQNPKIIAKRTAKTPQALDIIKHPHDVFFRKEFSRNDVARNLLENILPHSIAKNLNLHDLKSHQGNFIDDNLKQHVTDLLFSCPKHNPNIGKESKQIDTCFLLIEHKSYVDRYVLTQLLAYITSIIGQELKQRQKNELIPVTIPIIVYTGDRAWPKDLEFSNVFSSSSEDEIYIPKFHYEVFDLSCESDDFARFSTRVQNNLQMMKIIHKKSGFWTEIQKIFNRVKKIKGLTEREKIEHIRSLFIYALSGQNHTNKKTIQEILMSSDLDIEHEQMQNIVNSPAQIIFEEGIEKGIEKGRQEGRQEERAGFILSLLKHLDDDKILQIAEITPHELEQFKKLVHHDSNNK